MGHIVTAPLVGVNGSDGKIKYLYQGATVPSDISADAIKRLLGDGLIAKEGSDDSDEPTAAEKRTAAAAKAKADKEAAEKAAAGAKA
ncbi:hypothetical protein [Rhodococcus sp. B10]|uniref:hypothetical protein n=1 Tax=Rhodococcus sp. B10 TaxID=2695876 RepID=UPI00143009CD|nr:hypothetical protein [Rhodococcus sp. B10]NIL77609.1 hypothetical protein [Rhodococcus sp. B10]